MLNISEVPTSIRGQETDCIDCGFCFHSSLFCCEKISGMCVVNDSLFRTLINYDQVTIWLRSCNASHDDDYAW
jgi:hypothetical protein